MSMSDDAASTEAQFRGLGDGRFKIERDLANAKRTLQKAEEVLRRCDTYFEHQATMNATAHCADTVMRTPLHSKIKHALVGINMYAGTYGLETDA